MFHLYSILWRFCSQRFHDVLPLDSFWLALGSMDLYFSKMAPSLPSLASLKMQLAARFALAYFVEAETTMDDDEFFKHLSRTFDFEWKDKPLFKIQAGLLGEFAYFEDRLTLKDAIEQNLTQGIGWISPGMKDLYCQKVQEKNLQIEAANAKVDTAQKVVEACKTHPDVASFERCKATLDELQKKLEYNLRECAERNPSKREQEIQAAKHAIEDQKSSSINFPLPGGQKRKADMMEGTCELLDQLTCEYEIYAKEVKQLKPEIEVCQYLIKQASESDAAKEYHSAIDKVKQLKASAEGVKQERTGIRDVVDRVLTDQKLCDMEADIPLLENNAWIFIMHMQGFLTQPFQITQP